MIIAHLISNPQFNIIYEAFHISLHKNEWWSRVCITVENSPNPSSIYIRLCKHRKKVSYCFYKKTSSKNYNAGKDEKFILLIKTYLPATLIWQWDFSTHQSKLRSIKIQTDSDQSKFKLSFDVAYVQLYVTQPCLHTLMQTRLWANQSVRTILVIL